jgi:hypothetical protein
MAATPWAPAPFNVWAARATLAQSPSSAAERASPVNSWADSSNSCKMSLIAPVSPSQMALSTEQSICAASAVRETGLQRINALSNSAFCTGLARKSSMPAARQASRDSASAFAVKATIAVR